MIKTIFIIFLLLNLYAAIAQNPFSSLGVKDKDVRVLMLSNGKYEEFEQYKRYERVGSIVMDMQTMKIAYFIDRDTLRSEATLEPEIVSRWLSQDPLAAKYPNWSPYNAMGDNPIFNIDVDGRYFTGNIESVKAVYAITCELAKTHDPRAIAYKTELEKMDASDVEFNIQNTTKPGWTVGNGEGGSTAFDVENNRVVIDVYKFIGEEHAISKEGRVAHELKHGIQFLAGEISFNGSAPDKAFYDQTDEENAFQMQNMIDNTQLNPDKKQKTDEDAKNSASYPQGAPNKSTISPEEAELYKNSSQKTRTSVYNYKPTEKQKQEKKTILKDEKK